MRAMLFVFRPSFNFMELLSLHKFKSRLLYVVMRMIGLPAKQKKKTGSLLLSMAHTYMKFGGLIIFLLYIHLGKL